MIHFAAHEPNETKCILDLVHHWKTTHRSMWVISTFRNHGKWSHMHCQSVYNWIMSFAIILSIVFFEAVAVKVRQWLSSRDMHCNICLLLQEWYTPGRQYTVRFLALVCREQNHAASNCSSFMLFDRLSADQGWVEVTSWHLCLCLRHMLFNHVFGGVSLFRG